MLSRLPASSFCKFSPSCTDASVTLDMVRSEEHTSELQSPYDLVCRLLLEKKINKTRIGATAAATIGSIAVRGTGAGLGPTRRGTVGEGTLAMNSHNEMQMQYPTELRVHVT